MQLRMSFPRLLLAALALLALVALAACGSPTAPKAPAQPVARGTAAPANSSAPAVVPTNPPAPPNNPPAAQPTAPASTSGEGVKPGGEGAPGTEGSSPEGGPSIPSVTNPGGLPPSTQGGNMNTGEEKMVVYRDAPNRYQILFVNGWTTGAGNAAGSIKSTFQDRRIEIAVVNSGGQSALAFATTDEPNVKSAVPGYQRLALKPGQIPSGPVVSLIYRYQAGQNPVTGKALDFIAARVYAPRPGSNDLAIITVTSPASVYSDLSDLFDRIASSFKWLQKETQCSALKPFIVPSKRTARS